MTPTQLVVGALLLGVAKAQFLVSSADPSFALQPPPLHQGGFTSFASQPVTQAFVQVITACVWSKMQRPALSEIFPYRKWGCDCPQPSAPAPARPVVPAQAPLPIVRQQQNSGQPHHAVVRNSEDEARLPADLRNDFYKDARIAEALAKESWFTEKEMQVIL